MEELYLNGQLLDTDGKTNITLLFRSPILFDLKSIISNRSSTVSVPKTANNLKAINNCDMVDYLGDTPYVKHKVDYYRNGLPIIDGGVAIISGVDSQKINLLFIFGNIQNMDALNVKLNEMTETDFDYVDWKSTTRQLEWGYPYRNGFPIMDFGQGVNTGAYINENSSPCVGALEIIRYIQRHTGIVMDNPMPRFGDLYVLLTTRNNSLVINPRTPLSSGVSLFPTTFLTDGVRFIIPQNIISSSEIYPSYGDNYTFYGGGNRYENINIKFNEGNEFEFYVDIVSGLPFNMTCNMDIYGRNTNGQWVLVKSIWPIGVVADASRYRRVIHRINEDINLADYDYFRIGINSGRTNVGNTRITFITPITNINFTILGDEVVFGQKYPIIPNLPTITAIDFLKMTLNMKGLFAYTGDANEIKTVSLTEIYSSEPYDWSDKVIIPDAGVNTVYKLDNFARVNRMIYSNDNEVLPTLTDSSFEVENTYIDADADLVKIPLSGSIDVGSGSAITPVQRLAQVPMYTTENGQVKFKKLKPRILRAEKVIINGPEYVGLKFDGLSFKSIIPNYYVEYASIVNKPIIIEVYANLTDLDISTFSPIKPIYISHYNSYFLPIEIQSSNNGLAKCKLLKIKDAVSLPIPPFLSVAPESQSVPNTAGSFSFQIDSNTDWTIEGNAWLTPDVVSGTGGSGIVDNFIANTGVQRIGEIIIRAGSITQAVRVTQAAVKRFVVTPTSILVGDTGTYYIQVGSDDSWSLSSSSWIAKSPLNGGAGDYTITITVSAPKPVGTIREGYVDVTSGGITKKVVVNQNGYSPLMINNEDDSII